MDVTNTGKLPIAASQVSLPARGADDHVLALGRQRNAGLEERVDQDRLGQLQVTRQRVEVVDQRRVGVLADLPPSDRLGERGGGLAAERADVFCPLW
jgi:hypothetical protein